LARLARHAPVIGIGGIRAETVGSIVDAGAVGVAVIHAVFQAPDPRVAAGALARAVTAALTRRGSQGS
jgi:thiamine-phosphate pyrophosphorylase